MTPSGRQPSRLQSFGPQPAIRTQKPLFLKQRGMPRFPSVGVKPFQPGLLSLTRQAPSHLARRAYSLTACDPLQAVDESASPPATGMRVRIPATGGQSVVALELLKNFGHGAAAPVRFQLHKAKGPDACAIRAFGPSNGGSAMRLHPRPDRVCSYRDSLAAYARTHPRPLSRKKAHVGTPRQIAVAN